MWGGWFHITHTEQPRDPLSLEFCSFHGNMRVIEKKKIDSNGRKRDSLYAHTCERKQQNRWKQDRKKSPCAKREARWGPDQSPFLTIDETLLSSIKPVADWHRILIDYRLPVVLRDSPKWLCEWIMSAGLGMWRVYDWRERILDKISKPSGII